MKYMSAEIEKQKYFKRLQNHLGNTARFYQPPLTGPISYADLVGLFLWPPLLGGGGLCHGSERSEDPGKCSFTL